MNPSPQVGHDESPSLPDRTAAPEPFKHNPSSWSQRVRISVIASIAFFIAVYMALYQWRLIDSVWDPVFGDQTHDVLDSDLSHRMTRYMRIPDAALGALAYLGDIVFALAGSTRRWQYRPWLVLLFGLDVIPLGIVSALLVFAQGAIVGAWCGPCIVTAIISLVLVALAYDEVWSSLLYLWRVWRRSDARTAWSALVGNPSDVASDVAREMTDERRRKHEHRRGRHVHVASHD